MELLVTLISDFMVSKEDFGQKHFQQKNLMMLELR